MTDPLANVQRLVDDWERDAEEKAARYESMRQEVERISITASAAGGAVSVTVGPNGIPSAVTMTDGVSRLRPEQIAAAVMEAMGKAQAGYPAVSGSPVNGFIRRAPANTEELGLRLEWEGPMIDQHRFGTQTRVDGSTFSTDNHITRIYRRI